MDKIDLMLSALIGVACFGAAFCFFAAIVTFVS
jgi:hypothetical protein